MWLYYDCWVRSRWNQFAVFYITCILLWLIHNSIYFHFLIILWEDQIQHEKYTIKSTYCEANYFFYERLKKFQQIYLYKFWRIFFIKPAPAFHKLRRYHTRPLRLNWGPKNVHFKFKELPGATFFCFKFSTRVPNNGPKNGPKLKKHRKMTKTIFTLLGHSI